MEPTELPQEEQPLQPEEPPAHVPAIPAEPAPEITSRFLFVDVAAMRAKQLRRGALSRLAHAEVESHRGDPHKAERIAMEEHDVPLPDLRDA